MGYISTEFAKFVQGVRFEDLSDEIVFHAKKVILDLIGVALAGYPMSFSKMVVEYI